jgi:hypothetical protein
MPNFGYIIPGSPPDPLMPQARVATDSVGDRSTSTNFTFGSQWHGAGQGQSNSYLQQHQGQPSSLQSPIPPLPSPISPSTSAYPTEQSQSQPTKTGSNSWGISEESIPKIVEIRRLLYRHPDTFPNPDIIIQGAKHFCMMGDNTFLEEKLAYLRSVDVIAPPAPAHQQQQQHHRQDNFVV